MCGSADTPQLLNKPPFVVGNFRRAKFGLLTGILQISVQICGRVRGYGKIGQTTAEFHSEEKVLSVGHAFASIRDFIQYTTKVNRAWHILMFYRLLSSLILLL